MSGKEGASNRSAKIGRVPPLGNAKARTAPKSYDAIFKAALNRTKGRDASHQAKIKEQAEDVASKSRQRGFANQKFAAEVRSRAQSDARAELKAKAESARPQGKPQHPRTPQGAPRGGFKPPKT